MSVVHMWLPGDGQTAVWCGHDMLRADCAVTCHLVDAVTCTACLRSARDLVSACTTRLRVLVEDAPLSEGDVASRKRIQSLLGHLEQIADCATAYHAPEISARNIVKLTRVVAELVKHVAAKEQT